MPKEYQNNSYLHLTQSTYYYKYETYTGTENINPGLSYYFINIKNVFTSCLDQKSHILCRTQHPFLSSYVYTIKTVGIFQNHVWSTYRSNLNHSINYVFIYGLVLFVMFVLINMTIIHQLIFSNHKLKTITDNFLLIFVDMYIMLYSVFSIPESRFINPVLPALSYLFASKYKDIKKLSKTYIITIMILSIILYFYTENVIKFSMVK